MMRLSPKLQTRGTTIKRFYFDGTAADVWATDNSAHVSRSNVTQDGRAVMRLTIGTNATTYGNISQAISPSIDLTNCHGYLVCRADSSLPLQGMQVRFTSDVGGTLVTCSIWATRATYKRVTGWFIFPITYAELLRGTNATAERLASVNKIWITPSWTSADEGIVDLAELHLFAAPAKGKILIRMDDGYATQVTRATECLDRGIRPHIALIPRLLGTASFMTAAQALALQDRGAILLNHYHNITGETYSSATADGWVTTNGGGAQTVAAKRADYASAVALMTSGGFDKWGRYTVVPGGYEGTGDLSLIGEGVVDALWYTYNGTSMEAVINASGGSLVQGYNWPLEPDQCRQMATCALWDSVNAATMQAAVDRCIAARSFFPIHCHTPDATDFPTVLDYIAAAMAAGTLEVVTLDDLWLSPDSVMQPDGGELLTSSVRSDTATGAAAGGTLDVTADNPPTTSRVGIGL